MTTILVVNRELIHMRFLALLIALFSTSVFAQTYTKSRVLHFYHATAASSVAEVSTVATVADVGGALGGKYFDAYSAGDAVKYRVWIDVDDASVAPSSTGVTLVEVNIAEDATDAQVATAIVAAVDALAAFSASAVSEDITITNAQKGAATNIAAGTSGFTVGTSVAGVSGVVAISPSNAKGDVVLWRICNDAVNTSTHLFVGKSTTDPDSDGIMLGKGKCLVCENCATDLLKSFYVSSQAASNGYSVVQYQK